MTARLVEATGLSRRFGDRLVVDGVDVELSPGEVVGLIGANGAGKTTVIRLLLGLLRPTSGRVEIAGGPPSRATRRSVGYLSQQLGLYGDLSVEENWQFVRAGFGLARGALPDELSGVARELVAALPLGLQRLVAFAVALGHDPRLLVLDEPTSGVAPLGRAELWDRIRCAAEAGAGALVTTHDLEEAEQCDRLVVLSEGRVVASGTVAAIVAGRTVAEVRAASWPPAHRALLAAGLDPQLHGRALRVAAPAAMVGDALRTAHVDAVVTEVPASLEEAFVELVGEQATR